jgi:hypothetical protein
MLKLRSGGEKEEAALCYRKSLSISTRPVTAPFENTPTVYENNKVLLDFEQSIYISLTSNLKRSKSDSANASIHG